MALHGADRKPCIYRDLLLRARNCSDAAWKMTRIKNITSSTKNPKVRKLPLATSNSTKAATVSSMPPTLITTGNLVKNKIDTSCRAMKHLPKQEDQI